MPPAHTAIRVRESLRSRADLHHEEKGDWVCRYREIIAHELIALGIDHLRVFCQHRFLVVLDARKLHRRHPGFGAHAAQHPESCSPSSSPSRLGPAACLARSPGHAEAHPSGPDPHRVFECPPAAASNGGVLAFGVRGTLPHRRREVPSKAEPAPAVHPDFLSVSRVVVRRIEEPQKRTGIRLRLRRVLEQSRDRASKIHGAEPSKY